MAGVIKGEPPGEVTAVPPRRPHDRIDRVSKQVIEMLQLDGRRSYASMAEELDLAEENVQARVEALTAAGVIRSPRSRTRCAWASPASPCSASPWSGGRCAAVGDQVAQIPEVVYVVSTAGGFDLLLEVVGVSDAHLLELVTAQVKPIKGVTAIHTFLYRELIKQTYTWGTR